MTEKPFNFRQNHSDHYLETAFCFDRRGRVAHPDGYGRHTGQCGDTVEMFLTVKAGRIASVMFELDGCLHTNACANALVQLAEDRTVAEAWGIRPETVIEALQTLPPDHHHCAELVVGTFYRALAHHNELQRQPWKKAYSNR